MSVPESFPDRVQWRDRSELRASPRNPRRHDEAQIARIAASIRRFGWTVPLLVAGDGEIVAGEARWRAAGAAGAERLPVLVVDHLSPAERDAYRVADNRLAEAATWDEGLLATVLEDLAALDVDVGLIGFNADDLAALLRPVEQVEFPVLGEGDRAPFQQMTFVLHDDQAADVRRALEAAGLRGIAPAGPNRNRNGNALHAVCLGYLGAGHVG